MSKSKEEQLWDACNSGDIDVVRHLANDPAVNVNWADPGGHRTALFIACLHGRGSIVDVLLKYPEIDVNKTQTEKVSPFFIACAHGHQEMVLRLQKDLRIDVNQPNDGNCTPLWHASLKGLLPIVECLLASGRNVNTQARSMAGTAAWNDKTPVEMARRPGIRGMSDPDETEEEFATKKHSGPLIATLLDSFERNPQQVRAQLRKKLDFPRKQFLFSFLMLILDALS